MDSKLLVKLTQRRVDEITMEELYSLFPKTTALELNILSDTIRNVRELNSEAQHELIGSTILMMIYRITEGEVNGKV